MAGLIGGAALGAVFQELLKAILDAKKRALRFPSLLEKVEEILNTLKPEFEMACDLDENESTKWVERLKEGVALVKRCSEVRRYNVPKRWYYAGKLKKLDDLLDTLLKIMQARLLAKIREIRHLLEDSHENKKEGTKMFPGRCGVPEPPEFCVGIEKPIRELRMQLLQEGASVQVVSGPGGCGKTTLVKKLCKDEAVTGKFKDNIFYVTVSEKADLKLIMQKVFRSSSVQEVPNFENDEDALIQFEEFLKKRERKPILLILDDVPSGSEPVIEKFKFRISDYKILITSRSTFPRFDNTYTLKQLNYEDAVTLFCHLAFKEIEEFNATNEHLVQEIVKICGRVPLALEVIGNSLRGQPSATWRSMVNKGLSVLSNDDVLSCLRSSLDILAPEMKAFFMDMGSFLEDQRIPATVFVDMWGELYGMDNDTVVANIHELCSRSLASFSVAADDPSEAEGYYDKNFITQHDLLRELAIHQSSQKPMHQRERLYIDINEHGHPMCWIENKQHNVSSHLSWQQPFDARLLSISTDKSFSSNWCNMGVPNVEVLLLNFEATILSLPEFMKKMKNLKTLILTKQGFFEAEINNSQLLSNLPSLKRIRLEQVSLPSLFRHKLHMKNLQKITLVMCNLGQAFINIQISDMFPNLEDVNIDYCNDLKELPLGLCNVKKLSITHCPKLSALPTELGNSQNLETLRLQSCTGLLALPRSIGNLQSLRVLDISDCLKITTLQEEIGDIGTLEKLYTGGCKGLQELPQSIRNLRSLRLVICDDEMVHLWEDYKLQLENLKIEVRKEVSNLNWL